MNLANFAKKVLGLKNILSPGQPKYVAGECVQLVAIYLKDHDNYTMPIYPDAASYWEKGMPGYKKVPRGTHTQAEYGDIVVWNRQLAGSGGSGHIDVCLSQKQYTKNSFIGLDSNWTPLTVTEVRHTYQNVSGFLRKVK